MEKKRIVKKGISQIRNSFSSKHWFEDIIDSYLDARKGEARISEEFHPSGAGSCPRLIQLQMNGSVYEEVEPRIKRIFENGNFMQARYKKYLEGAGKFIEEEIPMRIEVDDIVIKGRADMIVLDNYDNKQLMEFKSINTRGFNELITNQAPKEEHLMQWTLYSHGLSLYDGVILYENKDDQRMKPFQVKYNSDLFNLIVAKFKMIDDCNKKGVLVPKPMKVNCYWCGAKRLCAKEK